MLIHPLSIQLTLENPWFTRTIFFLIWALLFWDLNGTTCIFIWLTSEISISLSLPKKSSLSPAFDSSFSLGPSYKLCRQPVASFLQSCPKETSLASTTSDCLDPNAVYNTSPGVHSAYLHVKSKPHLAHKTPLSLALKY